MRLRLALLSLISSVAAVSETKGAQHASRLMLLQRNLLPLLHREEASPSASNVSKSVGDEFPSPTTTGSVPSCAKDCYGKARDQTVRHISPKVSREIEVLC